MGLSQNQRSLLAKARVLGAGADSLVLSDGACVYLCAVIARDLGLRQHFAELPETLGFFNASDLESQTIEGHHFELVAERLFSLDKDADTYFACLANLHKRRLKYQRILRTQPIPTVDQLGSRSLLQFGTLSPRALGALLFWRKWIYDIDNRAAQETGYLFEPIIAHAIGGTPVSSSQSPIKRASDRSKGRQVDCVHGRRAYEFKIRVTIAASGQGRWGEELQFPQDCRKARFTPVLIVLDPTPNPKLSELTNAFLAARGEVHAGAAAWNHLESLAGATMSKFLELYVRGPIDAILTHAPDVLPDLTLSMTGNDISLSVGAEQLKIPRTPRETEEEQDQLPEDGADQLPGP